METVFELADRSLQKFGLARISSVQEVRDELARLKATFKESAERLDELSKRIDRLGS
jgi:hypothetical protein